MSRGRRFVFGLVGSAAAGASLLVAPAARAVIVDGSAGTGSNNVMTSGSLPPVAGASNAGTILGFSGVYLGNQWVLTASHIAANATIGAGTPFTLVNGTVLTTDQTSVRLKNADNSDTDLLLLHVSTNPGLANLTLSSSSPALGTSIYTMGNGLSRTGTSTSAAGTGYTIGSPNVYRWGSNTTTNAPNAATPTTVVDIGGGPVTVFASRFDNVAGDSQVSTGDSGGPVFSTGNVLLGINTASYTLANQPAGTAYYNDLSAYADLSVYRSQIASVTGVPEPTGAAALAAAAAGLLLRRRRRA